MATGAISKFRQSVKSFILQRARSQLKPASVLYLLLSALGMHLALSISRHKHLNINLRNGLRVDAKDFQGNKVIFIYDTAEVLRPTATKRAEKIMEIMKEKAEVASKTELARKMRVAKEYAIVEASLPKINNPEIEQIKKEVATVINFFKNNGYKDLTVRQALLFFLVGLEVWLWFFLGETFGKGSFVAYQV